MSASVVLDALRSNRKLCAFRWGVVHANGNFRECKQSREEITWTDFLAHLAGKRNPYLAIKLHPEPEGDRNRRSRPTFLRLIGMVVPTHTSTGNASCFSSRRRKHHQSFSLMLFAWRKKATHHMRNHRGARRRNAPTVGHPMRGHRGARRRNDHGRASNAGAQGNRESKGC